MLRITPLLLVFAVAFTGLALVPSPPAGRYFVAPDASSTGDGSERGPLIVRRDAAGAGQIWRDNDERPAPAITKVVVRPNLYEKGRAHVTVVNWGKDTKAQVDVSGVLAPGDRYEVRNVQDLLGAPISGGTVEGSSITIPLDGVAPPVPVGLTASPAPRTGPAFDVFLITKR